MCVDSRPREGGTPPLAKKDDGKKKKPSKNALPRAAPKSAAPKGDPENNERLIRAAAAGDLDGVKAALAAGADLAVKDGADMTALHLAARDGHLDIVKWLLERGAASSERLLRDVLTVASRSRLGKPQIVSVLQDWRLRIVAPSTAGASDANAKLMAAAHAGAADDVEAALKSGADVKSCDNRGLDALSWAALRGHERVVEVLLKHGAAVDALNSTGWPALGQAAGQGHAEVARILITGGAKVDIVFDSEKQVTPLHVAARQGHLEVVKVLLQAGADKSRRVGAGDEEGKTARELAADQGRDEVAALLRE